MGCDSATDGRHERNNNFITNNKVQISDKDNALLQCKICRDSIYKKIRSS